MKEYPITEQQAKEMFEDHATYIYGIALMLTKQHTLADDITQETFLRAFAKYHLYQSPKPLRPWLYRITVNITRSMMRKKSWHRLVSGTESERGADDSAETILLQSESEQQLWAAVGRLSHKQREVITLHYYAGLPLPETASALRIPLGTCKSRLHSALQKLRLFCESEPELSLLKEGMK